MYIPDPVISCSLEMEEVINPCCESFVLSIFISSRPHRQPWVCSSVATLFCILGMSVGCGKYTLKYDLPDQAFKSAKPYPFSVVVTTLKDVRPSEEQAASARGVRHDERPEDFTGDDEFSGEVNQEISKMAARHLAYANVFSGVKYVEMSLDNGQAGLLDSLHARGFNSVLTGEIRSFCGYFERNPGRELLYGLGLGCLLGVPPLFMDMYKEKTTYITIPRGQWYNGTWVSYSASTPLTTREYDPLPIMLSSLGFMLGALVGNYLEAGSERTLEQTCALTLRLRNTSTHAVIWEDSVTVHEKERRTARGTNKHELALAALRDGVGQLIEKMSRASITFEKP